MLIVLLGVGNGVTGSFREHAMTPGSQKINVWPGRTSKPYHGYREGRYIPLKSADLDRVADENIAAHPLMVRAWQMRAEATMVAFDGAVPAVLTVLRRRGIVADPLEVALELHIAADTAADALARLAALRLADFDYRAGRFVIIPASDEA